MTRGGADLPPPSKNEGNEWEVQKLSWDLISYREGFKIPTIRIPTIIIPTRRDFNWVRRDFNWVRRDFNWVSRDFNWVGRDFNWVRRDFNWVRLLTL